MNLFLNHFNSPHEERRREFQQCLDTNTSVFDRVILVGGRRTFNDLFDQMEAFPNDVNVLANLDVLFKPSFVADVEAANIAKGEVYALTRWELNPSGTCTHYGHADSQDAWVFRGAPTVDAPFHLGVPGCDGRLAYLLNAAGYVVTNPSNTLQAIHVHGSGIRPYLVDGKGVARGRAKLETVPGPYLRVPICSL